MRKIIEAAQASEPEELKQIKEQPQEEEKESFAQMSVEKAGMASSPDLKSEASIDTRTLDTMRNP